MWTSTRPTRPRYVGAIKEMAPQISEIQKDLDTKAQRENDNDIVASYLRKLRVRAKEHGIRREKQRAREIQRNTWNRLLTRCVTSFVAGFLDKRLASANASRRTGVWMRVGTAQEPASRYG